MANATSSRYLLESILDQGIRNTNFFNGRILTADDLRTEQDANREQHEQLGQAIGTGIANGLEVTLVKDGSDGEPPILSVAAGLGLNRKGEVIALPLEVQVALARQIEPLPAEAGLFAECRPPKTGTIPRDRGVYVFVAAPASGFREQAPMRGFGNNGKVVSCGSRYAVEGIKFRLEELKITELGGLSQTTRDALLDLMTKNDVASLSKLRNWLAHICFGTEELIGFLRDPFTRRDGRSAYTIYGALDALRTKGLVTDCDVPMALLYWTPSGVQFLDMWSVRRRPIPLPRSAIWPLPVSERRQAEGEAIFLQFQEQLDTLFRSKISDFALASIQAIDYFRYLPPGGFLALRQGSLRGIDPATFFKQKPHRDPEFIDGAVIEAGLKESMMHESIDLAVDELVWLYKTWQNAKAVDEGEKVQPYLVFTSGHMSHKAVARLDIARWNYSNYVD